MCNTGSAIAIKMAIGRSFDAVATNPVFIINTYRMGAIAVRSLVEDWT